jgi:hypothetical protein
MILSKALAAIIISAFVAAPASALAKEEGWYIVENGTETPLHLTMKLPAGHDNTKNIYACYYTPDAGKSEKDRWSDCGRKRDPRVPKEEKVAVTAASSSTPAPAATSPTDCTRESDPHYLDCPAHIQPVNMAGNYVPVVSNDSSIYRYLDIKYQEPQSAQVRQEPYYYPVPRTYYAPYYSTYPTYYSYYPESYCCYSSYNSKPISKTGKALLGVGAAALVAGFVVR